MNDEKLVEMELVDLMSDEEAVCQLIWNNRRVREAIQKALTEPPSANDLSPSQHDRIRTLFEFATTGQ